MRFKYNHKEGSVRIISDDSGAKFIRIGVSDTGIGISPEKFNELFQPFNRLGAEFSGIEGSGIGLVITRQLIKLMNGKLDIDSQPDVGSTFWITLALAPFREPTNVIELPVLDKPEG